MYTIEKTKKTRRAKLVKRRNTRRSTPPFSPLLAMMGGDENKNNLFKNISNAAFDAARGTAKGTAPAVPAAPADSTTPAAPADSTASTAPADSTAPAAADSTASPADSTAPAAAAAPPTDSTASPADSTADSTAPAAKPEAPWLVSIRKIINNESIKGNVDYKQTLKGIKELVKSSCNNILDDCKKEIVQQILQTLRIAIKKDEMIGDIPVSKLIEKVEQDANIIYIEGFEDKYLLEISTFFDKPSAADKIKVINDILKCIIFRIRNKDAEFPTDLSVYQNLFSNEAISKNFIATDITVVGKPVKITDDKKLEIAQQQIAAAMWVRLLRTLDDSLEEKVA